MLAARIGQRRFFRPLSQFLRGLAFVVTHLREQAGVHGVQVNDLEIVAFADALHLMHDQAGLTARNLLHLRIGPAFVNDALHPLPPVIEGRDPLHAVGNALCQHRFAEGFDVARNELLEIVLVLPAI